MMKLATQFAKERLLDPKGDQVPLSCSCGVLTITDSSKNAREVYNRADQLMYAAKHEAHKNAGKSVLLADGGAIQLI